MAREADHFKSALFSFFADLRYVNGQFGVMKCQGSRLSLSLGAILAGLGILMQEYLGIDRHCRNK